MHNFTGSRSLMTVGFAFHQIVGHNSILGMAQFDCIASMNQFISGAMKHILQDISILSSLARDEFLSFPR